MQSRNRVVVRIWHPSLRTIKVFGEIPDATQAFKIGHISFEQNDYYGSAWSIEKPKYSNAFYKERYCDSFFERDFETLFNKYKTEIKPTSLLEYDIELEGRAPDAVLCFYNVPSRLNHRLYDFGNRIQAFLGSCTEGLPPVSRVYIGWRWPAYGLLINLEQGGRSCAAVALDLLAIDKHTKSFHFKLDDESDSYYLPDNAGFKDFLGMLGKIKQEEIKRHPELSGNDFIYPEETLLNDLPKDESKRSCVLL